MTSIAPHKSERNKQERMEQWPFPKTAGQLYASILWNSSITTTNSIKRQQQLAYALGYPLGWRVERSVQETQRVQPNVTTKEQETKETKETKETTSSPTNESAKNDASETKDENSKDVIEVSSEINTPSVSQSKNKVLVITDTIHATGKQDTKYTWFHHQAAHEAAMPILNPNQTTTGTNGKPFSASSTSLLYPTTSHLLPPIPKFAKGDRVQVDWNEDDKWYSGGIVIKRKRKGDDFWYMVSDDHSPGYKQEFILQDHIRPQDDPHELAISMGFPSDWSVTRKPGSSSRYTIISSSGKQFQSRKAAMNHLATLSSELDEENDDTSGAKKKKKTASPTKKKKRSDGEDGEEENTATKDNNDEDMGDPPWRTTGHDLLGRSILWKTHLKLSATRKFDIEQIGTIVGFIKESDVDKEGNPGFVSDRSGKPADLFHIVFPDEPNHAYPSHLISAQDLELDEVQECLLPEEEPQQTQPKPQALEVKPPPSESTGATATATATATTSTSTPTTTTATTTTLETTRKRRGRPPSSKKKSKKKKKSVWG